MLDGDSALGLTLGTDLFAFDMPEKPDVCVSVMDSGGNDPEPEPSLETDYPTVQVRVRGMRGSYPTIWQRAKAIADFLRDTHGPNEVEIEGSRYVGIWQAGGILDIGPDENGRPEVSINFRIHRTATTS
jgi:hypothetical protein